MGKLIQSWKILLYYTWFIVVWGAFVRASGSGDGCGKNWPTCNGELIPSNSSIQTLIEYIHRASSGIYGIFVAVIVLVTLNVVLKRNKQKALLHYKWALALPIMVFVLTIFEALIGAQLVLSGLVGSNDSWARALTMIIHLVNTFILVASIVGTTYVLSIIPLKFQDPKQDPNDITTLPIIKNQNLTLDFKKSLFAFCTLSLIFVAALGALTALGDTLYPAGSLKEGVIQDLAEDSPWLLRLRVLHPLLAVLTVYFITTLCYDLLKHKIVKLYLGVTYFTLVIGVINLLLLAPIYMQLIHLLTAQVLWSVHSHLGFQLFIPKVKKLI
jgi:cytochrome c oxidase assembly protein subunit 15